MIRRFHTRQIQEREVELDEAASRHLRDVLRLREGARVEVFDDAGQVADGVVVRLDPRVTIRIESVFTSMTPAFRLTVASAIPKGERADWMVEKLSELGVWRFVPLAAERSIVLPEGKNKRRRWERLAAQSAGQSRRTGVMRIDELTAPAKLLLNNPASILCLSTRADAISIQTVMRHFLDAGPARDMTLLIGPEGGWTDGEIAQFERAGVPSVKLTDTILRIETAAIASAAIVLQYACSP